MDAKKSAFTSIDDYIATFPPPTQVILQQIRAALRQALPDATEKISYQMPTFYLNGNVVHFAAWKDHIGFYPAPNGLAQFEPELAAYNRSKGSVHFPLDQPLPIDLIQRIARFRAEENRQKAAAKKRK